MGHKHHKPEEIVAELRQVEVLTGQGRSIAEAARSIGVSEQTYFRWRAEYGGMKTDQLKRLKELELENRRLRHAVSDLTLDRQILARPPGGTSKPRPPPRLRGDGAGEPERIRTPGLPKSLGSTAPRRARRARGR